MDTDVKGYRRTMRQTVQFCQRVVGTKVFDRVIMAIVIGNSLLLGLRTAPSLVAEYGVWMDRVNDAVLVVFIVEALFKMAALAPRSDRYFRDGWNIFDFSVIVLGLIPVTGEFALIFRLLRIVRLVSVIKELRVIVGTLIRSLIGVSYIILMLCIVTYIYAIVGSLLFSDHDPEHWGTLGTATLTLFTVITLEGWVEVMEKALEFHPLGWLYFLSFIVLSSFVVINMFIAVIVDSWNKADMERRATNVEPSREDLMREIQVTQEYLEGIERQLKGQVRTEAENEGRGRPSG